MLSPTTAEVNMKFVSEAGDQNCLQDLFTAAMFMSVVHDPAAAQELRRFTRNRCFADNLEGFESVSCIRIPLIIESRNN